MELADLHIQLPEKLATQLKERRKNKGILIRKQVEQALRKDLEEEKSENYE